MTALPEKASGSEGRVGGWATGHGGTGGHGAAIGKVLSPQIPELSEPGDSFSKGKLNSLSEKTRRPWLLNSLSNSSRWTSLYTLAPIDASPGGSRGHGSGMNEATVEEAKDRRGRQGKTNVLFCGTSQSLHCALVPCASPRRGGEKADIRPLGQKGREEESPSQPRAGGRAGGRPGSHPRSRQARSSPPPPCAAQEGPPGLAQVLSACYHEVPEKLPPRGAKSLLHSAALSPSFDC